MVTSDEATLAFGNDGLDSVFVDADDDVENFLRVDGDGGRSVLVVKSLAPPGGDNQSSITWGSHTV